MDTLFILEHAVAEVLNISDFNTSYANTFIGYILNGEIKGAFQHFVNCNHLLFCQESDDTTFPSVHSK